MLPVVSVEGGGGGRHCELEAVQGGEAVFMCLFHLLGIWI